MCFFLRVGNESANATGFQGEMSGAISTAGLSQELGRILAEETDLSCRHPMLELTPSSLLLSEWGK